MTGTMAGNITGLLKPQYRVYGYSLSEDEDFLYLHLDGKQIAVFSSHRMTLEQVEKFIESHRIAENLNDYWKHLGQAD